MMINIGKPSYNFQELFDSIDESMVFSYYFHIRELPVLIKSPLRKDRNPSFGVQLYNGRIGWKDFSTGETGGLIKLLNRYWNTSTIETIRKIRSDITRFSNISSDSNKELRLRKTNKSEIEIKVREWKDYDIEYWKQYGITLEWLKYAEVYPISHKIIIKNGKRMVFGADKLCYAFTERRNNKVTFKIYSPLRKRDNYKWISSHDKKVISLWTKIPEKGKILCLCSSVKDCLCLSCNTHIPAICMQGEGYIPSNNIIQKLKEKYEKIYILYDNDEAGIQDGIKLAELTGFINLTLPYFEGGKDISDAYKVKGKDEFLKMILPLFKQD